MSTVARLESEVDLNLLYVSWYADQGDSEATQEQYHYLSNPFHLKWYSTTPE